MRVLIVEDETMVARRLQRMLGEVFGDEAHELVLAHTFASARAQLETERIELVFLDLNLNGANGFALLAEAVAGPFETIVVSANTDRALEAFEYGVLDFVPKPFNRERLAKAVGRFRERGSDQPPAKQLAVKQGGRVLLVPLAEVVALHGAGNYAEIETRDGARYLHDKGLDRLAQVLPADFVRIHRSHIVAWREVVSLEAESGSRYHLVLKSGARLPVSRARVKELRQRLL